MRQREGRALPRLGMRSLFVLLGLLVLCLAGAGLVLFRVYDNQLIRQTEAELIAQGTSLASAFKKALLERLPERSPADAPSAQAYGVPVAERFRDLYKPGQPLRARQAGLALGSDAVRGRAEPAHAPAVPADAAALAAGESLAPILEETKQTTLAGLRIVDFRGTVVASSGLELGQSLAEREEVRRALQGEMTSLLRRRVSDEPAPPYSSLSRETGVRVFVALPVVASERVLGAVVLSRTPMTLGKAFYQDRMSLLAMAAILVAAVLAVSLLAAAFIVRPVRALIRQTDAIAAGQSGGAEPLTRPGTREIAQLSQSFAEMSNRLSERAQYIRGFAASVSHEFKTPLTAIRGTVELLRDHGGDMDAEDRERFLANLMQDTERLGQLVHRLLELARADVLSRSTEACCVKSVVDQLVERYRRDGATFATSGLEAAEIQMSSDTLEAILCHLIDNARVHAGKDVAILISRGADVLGQAVVLDVSDNGPGISEANRSRIFEPFFTTNRDRGGTGMGLTIARALVVSHGGTLELLPSTQGARFRLVLPRSSTDGSSLSRAGRAAPSASRP
jgi:signal transduction histidine kinase